jgi:ribosome maturation factor RimP
MISLKKKIAKLIPEDLVFLGFVEKNSHSSVKVIIDGGGTVDLRTTARIAKSIKNSGLLEEFYPRGCQFEVTTPGIDAPLKHPIQFKKNLGRSVKVRMFGKSEAILVEICHVDDNSFEGLSVVGVKSRFQFSEIESAIVVIKF